MPRILTDKEVVAKQAERITTHVELEAHQAGDPGWRHCWYNLLTAAVAEIDDGRIDPRMQEYIGTIFLSRARVNLQYAELHDHHPNYRRDHLEEAASDIERARQAFGRDLDLGLHEKLDALKKELIAA